MKRLIGCLLITAICVGLNGTAQADQLVGKGEWQSLSGEAMRGTWTVALERDDNGRLDGSLTMTGSNALTDAQISGTVDGQQVVLGVLANGERVASFTGKLTGENVAGEWQFAGVKDEGVWSGSLRHSPAGDSGN